MARVPLFSGAVIVLCTILALVFAASGQDSGQGKALFEQYCVLCHGAEGKGNGPAAASLNPHPTDFTSPQFWQGEVDKKITESIQKGKGTMPAFQLSKTEITAVIDYLKKAFKK